MQNGRSASFSAKQLIGMRYLKEVADQGQYVGTREVAGRQDSVRALAAFSAGIQHVLLVKDTLTYGLS